MSDYVTLRLVNEEGFHKSILDKCEKEVAMNFLDGFKHGRQLVKLDATYSNLEMSNSIMNVTGKPDIWFKGFQCGFENKVGTVEVIPHEE
jgi:hypothetical protein